METAQQSERCSGTADYYSQRKLHPRTGDHNAFTGRTSQQSISPRSEFPEDLWATDSSFHEPLDQDPVPGNADVELEGVTADGGMALNVEFASGDDVQEPSAACAEHEDVLPAERQQVADHVLLSASCSMLSYCMYLSTTKAFEDMCGAVSLALSCIQLHQASARLSCCMQLLIHASTSY